MKKPQSKEDSQCAVEAAEIRGQGPILGNLPLPLCSFGKVSPCLLLQFLVWDLADVTDGFPYRDFSHPDSKMPARSDLREECLILTHF